MTMQVKYVECPKDYSYDFISHRKNVYSQNGEDGVLQRVFELLNIKNGTACEFGAWDGIKHSNTFRLVSEEKWSCVMIEGDPEKFSDLLKTAERHPEITPILSMVHYIEGKGRLLDDILEKTDIPSDFDLLSVDVDSCDYHIWKSLTNYRPKVVVIEHSGLDAHIIQREGAVHKVHIDGSTSFWPMKELADQKGYRLLCDTGNLIFLRQDLVEVLETNMGL